MKRGKKVVFFGATRGMGRALARRMAERGDEIFLLGRDSLGQGHEESELARSAADLAVRRGGEVGYALCDLARPETFAPALEAATEKLGGFDTVVITAGVFASQEELEEDTAAVLELLTLDFTHTVAFCEEARRRLLAQGGGRLCVFSSVAGDRGRKPVVIYGAAKGGLSRYLEALDHKYRSEGLVTVCVKPGFVKTGMTAGLKPPPFAGEPDAVARRVLAALDRGRPVVYAPAIWRYILLVIRLLPRFVMRRIGF